jgi:chromosomal replication initiator protein
MQAWEDYVLSLERSFGKRATDEWIRTLKLIRFDACNLYLEARDTFHASWVEEHILPIAKKQLRNNNAHEIKIHLKIHGEDGKNFPPDLGINEAPLNFSPDLLNQQQTYEQFVPGSKNRIPFQVLCKLTGFNPERGQYEEPSKEIYNPIYLYGPSGSGKTHLLVAAAITLELRGFSVFYVRAQTFTDHVVRAIRSGHMQKFRSAYRHIDILIIDDIQVLSRKNATQEELFHTFNTLHTAGKQIILSSNVNPRQLEGIEERLVSRFEWGITLPIEKLTEPLELLQIAKNRLQFYGFSVKKEVIDFIISSFNSPPRVCEAIDRIAIKYQLSKADLYPLETFLPTLNDLIQQDQQTSLSSQKILELVADIFGIKVEDILSKSQSREIVLPRQIAMYLFRKELKMPYIKIGSVFSRDHSTVMSSIKQITKSIEIQDKDLFYYLNDIQRKIANV